MKALVWLGPAAAQPAAGGGVPGMEAAGSRGAGRAGPTRAAFGLGRGGGSCQEGDLRNVVGMLTLTFSCCLAPSSGDQGQGQKPGPGDTAWQKSWGWLTLGAQPPNHHESIVGLLGWQEPPTSPVPTGSSPGSPPRVLPQDGRVLPCDSRAECPLSTLASRFRVSEPLEADV